MSFFTIFFSHKKIGGTEAVVEDFVEVAGANSLFQLIDLVLIKISIQFNQFSWLPTNIIYLYALYFSNINIWCWSINFTTHTG